MHLSPAVAILCVWAVYASSEAAARDLLLHEVVASAHELTVCLDTTTEVAPELSVCPDIWITYLDYDFGLP